MVKLASLYIALLKVTEPWTPLSEDFPISNLLLFGLRCFVSHYVNLTKTVLLECQMWFIIGHFKIVKIYLYAFLHNEQLTMWMDPFLNDSLYF